VIQVQEVLDELAKAFRVAAPTLVDRIQQWDTEGRHAREATLTKETYHAYKSGLPHKGQLSAVIIFLEYLAAHSDQVKNPSAAHRLRANLLTHLESAKQTRFERNVGHEPFVEAGQIDRFSGAYALCRIESNTLIPCQELLLLNPSKKRERTRYAAFVGHNLVVRGRWHLLGSAIYVEGLGYRPGHQPDFLNMSLARGTDPNVLGGVLTGLATANRDLLTMSVLAIKIDDVDSALFDIGTNCDPEIIERFNAVVPKEMDDQCWQAIWHVHQEVFQRAEHQDRLAQSSWFEPKIIGVTDPFVAHVRSIHPLSRLIMPELLEFCQSGAQSFKREGAPKLFAGEGI
jgi:hypothetical protein